LQALDKFLVPSPGGPRTSVEDTIRFARLQDPNYLLQQAMEVIDSRRIDVDLHFAPRVRA
jgi:hypothetical protein